MRNNKPILGPLPPNPNPPPILGPSMSTSGVFTPPPIPKPPPIPPPMFISGASAFTFTSSSGVSMSRSPPISA